VRRRVLDRRPEPSAPSPWLHPHVDAAVRERWRAARAAEPVRHDRALLRDWWRSRYLQVTRESLALLGAGHDAAVLHPFTEPGFLVALARERGATGPRHRTREMVALFGDVLPQETVSRVGKATFNGAFWGPRTRAFAQQWDGTGVDPALVDVPALQREWASDDPDARTYPLLQAAVVSRVR
jgi:asparagine synthase (glutamine-hydrolysing)